jgi:Arc/MetJ-type ribon-helix-helix transcriptional regulator
MKNPKRITIGLDPEISDLLEEMTRESKVSRSELIRRALRFYSDNKALAEVEGKKMATYMDMLPSGEHLILDVDHWLLFLKYIESSSEKERFWEECRAVAKSHAEQLPNKVGGVEGFLERLEACNFFKLKKNSENQFTLILGSDIPKKFVKRLVNDVLSEMGFTTEIREDFAKLRIKIE